MGSVLIKIGGALLGDEERLAAFWISVKRLQDTNRITVVHGGGPQATAMARRLGHEPRMVHGRRVTSDLDLDIIRWALRGELNAKLVAQARSHDIDAVGISGIDGGILHVERRPPWQVEGESVDFGWVGDVTGINTRLIENLVSGGFVPILAPLGIDHAGDVYNVNADTVASEVARALKVRRLLLVAESAGVWKDSSIADSRVAEIDSRQFENGIAAGWVEGGMRVKLHVGFQALKAGVSEVYICGPGDLERPGSGTRLK